jgi:hypothetical protein
MPKEVETEEKQSGLEETKDEEENVNSSKEEEAYDRIKSKVEILDIIFHPKENTILNAGLINGKLKM